MHHYLSPLLTPKSVALVGASERTGSLGRTVFENLLAGQFHGEIFVVPTDPEIGENHLQLIGPAKFWNDNVGNADFITGYVVEFDTAPEPGIFALLAVAGLTLLVLRAKRAAETPWRPSRPGSRRTSR